MALFKHVAGKNHPNFERNVTHLGRVGRKMKTAKTLSQSPAGGGGSMNYGSTADD